MDFIIISSIVVSLTSAVGFILYDMYSSPYMDESERTIYKRLEAIEESLEEISSKLDDDAESMTVEPDVSLRYFSENGYKAYYIREENENFILNLPDITIRGCCITGVHEVRITRSCENSVAVVIDYVKSYDEKCFIKTWFHSEETANNFMNWIRP